MTTAIPPPIIGQIATLDDAAKALQNIRAWFQNGGVENAAGAAAQAVLNPPPTKAGSNTGSVGGQPVLPPPATPQGVTAVAGFNNLFIYWQFQSDPNIIGYSIQYSTTSSSGPWTTVNVPSGSLYSLTNTPPLIQYWARVASINKNGMSAYSAVATATTVQVDASTSVIAGTIIGNLIAAGTIVGNNIAAGTITANLLNVTALSAITANIGTVETAS